jgi:hypothetical protein
MLIAAQRPNATYVAGYRKWQRLGRQVRMGEKAIKILGYATKKITKTDPDTGEETEDRLIRYPVLSVFDRLSRDSMRRFVVGSVGDPFGQVAMPAAWSTVKSSTVNPPGTAGRDGAGLTRSVWPRSPSSARRSHTSSPTYALPTPTSTPAHGSRRPRRQRRRRRS